MIGNCLGGPFGRRYGGYTQTEITRREPAEQPKTKKSPKGQKSQKPQPQRREPQQQRAPQEPFRNCWGTGY